MRIAVCCVTRLRVRGEGRCGCRCAGLRTALCHVPRELGRRGKNSYGCRCTGVGTALCHVTRGWDWRVSTAMDVARHGLGAALCCVTRGLRVMTAMNAMVWPGYSCLLCDQGFEGEDNWGMDWGQLPAVCPESWEWGQSWYRLSTTVCCVARGLWVRLAMVGVVPKWGRLSTVWLGDGSEGNCWCRGMGWGQLPSVWPGGCFKNTYEL